MAKESSMKSANPRILTINGGSSSIKFALFDVGETLQRVIEGGIEKIGLPDAFLKVKDLNLLDDFRVLVPNSQDAVNFLVDWIKENIGDDGLIAVGHRVVHGGPKYYKPQQITEKMISDLRAISSFDPVHMPQEISLIEIFRLRFPELFQIACFDTAFHHELPIEARMLPIPRHYAAQGIRRYGFHGLSYEFLMEELTHLVGMEKAQKRVILAHLGNGVSLTAVNHGKSLDTTMSFTPTAGVPMGTRSGDLDPGLVWYLGQIEGLDVKRYNHMVNFESGLLGISETTSDMQDLLKIETKDFRAAEAIALFCYQIKKAIGAFAASLGGVDILVFSGGIGENSSIIRERICDGLEFLGIELEDKLNKDNSSVISKPSGKVEVRVIATDEGLMIAKTLCRVLKIE